MSSESNHADSRSAVLAILARANVYPTEEELAVAPFLDKWEVVRDAFNYTILYGRVTRHPTLRGPAIKTSPLLWLNALAGWARTFSRFYRLGEPLSAGRPQQSDAVNDGFYEMLETEMEDGIRRDRDLILASPQLFRRAGPA